VVDDVLPTQLKRQHTVLAVRLLANGRNDRQLADVGAHRELVEPWSQCHVVDENGSDLLAQQVVMKGGVSLQEICILVAHSISFTRTHKPIPTVADQQLTDPGF